MHQQNCFITLTYDEQHYQPGLNYADFKKFIRRLVAHKNQDRDPKTEPEPRKIRYFMCGEYGDKYKRPHYHAILFGQDFTDRKNLGKIDTSQQLNSLWKKGFASVGNATYESAGYIARYTVKKVYGPKQQQHYERVHLQTGEIIQVKPEFAQMSRRPGIGQTFIEKYWPEIFLARDGVVLKAGKTKSAPRYYNKWLQQTNTDLKEWKDYERYIKSKQFEKDTTPERLKIRELIATENINRKLRTLE